MSTNPNPKPPRSTWTTETIRAADLTGEDTVLIDGIWREIFDTWKDGNDPAAVFGEDDPTTKALLEKIDWGSPCWVGVRYVSEERSDEDHIQDALHFFRLRDLVQVQKEIPASVPAPTPQQADE